MKTPLCFIAGLALAALGFSRDFRPEAHLETIPAADSSVQECYVFRTTAGVSYTMEASNDLTHWTAQEEIYGLGNEYVLTMRQFTPPPPPPPGSPPITLPPPAKNVSLRMERSSAAEGGTVVSWPSLDHGGPLIVRIAGEMVPEWSQIPLYFERFSNFYFFVWHPDAQASPPAVNSVLGANDSAMLAVLEASLPTMNAQATASVAAGRNAPVPTPVPVDPDSKRFWRILVDSGIDTDSDGTPDWSEFEMAANAVAGLPVRTIGTFPNGTAPIGNAFNFDSNSDGIPDGEQLDTDKDGVEDAFDIASSDATASYDIGPLPRYALFEIPGNALQISDLGTVLYSDKTWKGGSITNLPGGPPGAPPASGRGINDLDVIIGTEGRNPNDPANPQYLNGKICFWPSPTQPYQYVRVTDQGEDVFAYRQHDGFGGQGPAPILSLSGQFIAHGHVLDPEPGYVDEFGWAPTLWQTPTASSGANRQAITPSTFPALPFVPFNTIPQLLPDGGTAVFATPPVDFTNSTDGQTTKVYLDGKWQETPTFAMALDISSDGTAIGQAHDGLNAPILLNGKWTDIKRYAPGAPSEWADINTDLLDTTPSGWVLGKRNNGTNAGANGVLLPLRVDGVNASVTPVILEDPAGGVDRISMGARSGTGHVPEIWIMAPVGGSNPGRFRAPLNAVSSLKLQCDKVTFTPDLLNTLDQQIQVSGDPSATTTEDVQPVLKLGNQADSLSVPIRIKVMKKRAVKVALHKVVGLGDTSAQTTPQYMPTEAQLEQYLDHVYGRQVNTTFDVTSYVESGPNRPHPEEEGIDFDLNNDHKLYVPTASPELTAATPHPKSFGQTATANVDVWVIGGGVALMHFDQNSVEKQAYGVTYGSTNIVVDGDLTVMPGRSSNIPTGGELKQVMHIIAHEIGHVMTDDGHRGEPGYESVLVWKGGKDPYLKKRLMCSGFEADPKNPGGCLIKKEWDRIEEWLRNEEANQRL